jgi:hypothetical protein
VLGQGEADHFAHRVAEEVGLLDLEIVEDTDDVVRHSLQGVRLAVLGFVTSTLASCVDADEPPYVLRSVDVSSTKSPPVPPRRWSRIRGGPSPSTS